jgi:N-acetylmuramoyl-L-alanine amidase
MRKRFFAFLLAVFLVSAALPAQQAEAAGPTLRFGSTGGDVWDLQFRLQILGYYNIKLDGVYGSSTVQAVRRFQQNYGLTADGVAGPRTWAALKRVSVNARELTLLARAVYSEARGEPYVGQVAIAAVIMNRLQSPHFPNTVAGVIFQRNAFTAVQDGQFWLEPDATAYAAAWDAVRGWDPTGGALYYFNPATATSEWIWTRKQTGKIGNHIFAI